MSCAATIVRAICLLALVVSQASASEDGPRKSRRALPQEYGRVVISNYSQANRIAPVVFSHWLHRAKYTCRVCHVDIGFAMKAGATEIRAADNMAGQYCGACHNGTAPAAGEKTIFEACRKANPADPDATCTRCHSLGRNVKPEYDFATFTKNFPKERFGNGIDWERAEKEKVITPSDAVKKISLARTRLTGAKDFSLPADMEGMPAIIFSHAKHTVWNGCEVCHPDIYNTRAGTTKDTMVQIFEGKSCGVCHQSVAFPLIDCQRCHTTPVQ